MNKQPQTDRIIIFDTTLRDGEQCPGATLNVDEKLVIARQLARLGVDVIEAGFAFASPGDFEAVEKIAKKSDIHLTVLGETGAEYDLKLAGGKSISIEELKRLNESWLPSYMEGRE